LWPIKLQGLVVISGKRRYLEPQPQDEVKIVRMIARKREKERDQSFLENRQVLVEGKDQTFRPEAERGVADK